MTKYQWVKQNEQIEEIVKATHDPLKDFVQDETGYFLIRINKKDKQIEVGFVTTNHIITKEIIGRTATAIYNTIINMELITRFEHAAYLGKELYKAELALKHDLEYKQEFPLKF